MTASLPFAAHETSTSYSSYESIYPALRDDDHFGLLLKTLPTLSLPSEIVLTSSTFDEHIQSYDKTAVIFYTQCKYGTHIYSKTCLFRSPYNKATLSIEATCPSPKESTTLTFNISKEATSMVRPLSPGPWWWFYCISVKFM